METGFWITVFIISIVFLWILGAGVIYYVFPSFWKRQKIWKKIIFSLILGTIITFIASILHPVVLVLPIYLIGIGFLIFAPSIDLKIILKRMFFAAWFTIAVIQFAFFGSSNFIKICSRTRQSEAKTNLASISTSEIAYFSEFNTFSGRFDQIGWEPQGNKRYSYYFSVNYEPGTFLKCDECLPLSEAPTYFHWDGFNQILSWRLGKIEKTADREYGKVEGEKLKEVASKYGIGVGKDNFTAIGIGNIDSDSFLDVWLINKNKRPINIENDVFNTSEIEIVHDLWVVEIYRDHFLVYADRLSLILVIINAALWGFFTVLVRLSKENTASDYEA